MIVGRKDRPKCLSSEADDNKTHMRRNCAEFCQIADAIVDLYNNERALTVTLVEHTCAPCHGNHSIV